MNEEPIRLGGKQKSKFVDKVKEILPEGGNLSLCLTCGACSSGCPATGLDGMDPRKFLRMAALGLDDVILKSDWVWMCSMCQRCIYVCPMKIDIPQLVYNVRQSWPRRLDIALLATNGACASATRRLSTPWRLVAEVPEETVVSGQGADSLWWPNPIGGVGQSLRIDDLAWILR